jgi:transcriptional regulator with XRE-family HTH domain
VDGAFGDVLKSLRTESGQSLRDIAKAAHVSHTYIWDLETHRGAIPSREIAEALDHALNAGGRLIAATLVAPRTLLSPDDAERLRHVTENHNRLDMKAVASFQAVLTEQRRLDDVLGSTPLLEPVAAFLRRIEAMVTDAQDPIREPVLRMAAQWAQFAGWLNTATENWSQAEHWFGTALVWASEAGDQEMVATVLSYRGHVAWLTGHVASTVGLAQAAQRDRSIYPGQLAYDALQEARGRAIMGDVRRAAGLIAYAGDLIGPAIVQLGEAPPWHYYRSQAMWDLEVGRSYLYIPGRAGDAARLLEAGLAVTPEADVEWMASYHDDLARARKLSA